MRIVVADDSPIQAQLVKRMVEEGGHEVVAIANDGRPAVQHCADLHPDVLLIDIAMPQDGETTAGEVLKQERPPKVIFVTNQGRDSTRMRADAMGAGLVVKPFVAERLYSEIARVTGVSLESQLAHRAKVMESLDAN